MRRALALSSFVALLALGLVLPGCGSSKKRRPTLVSITPTAGTTLGGTAITITGTRFTAPATVSLGGSAATGVVVVDSTTITAVTSAHAAGTVDLVVVTGGSTLTLTDAFTYVTPPPPPPAPTITSLSVVRGTVAGGTSVLITGSGFASGPTTATFGGTAAVGVVVVNDTTLQVMTQANAEGPVAVAVTTAGGTATLVAAFTFVTPTLYAAVAQQSGVAGGASDLFQVDPVTGTATLIGPIGFAITGLAMHPTTGVLYGIDVEFAAQSLYTIDVNTGAATLVGPLTAPTDNVGDITFVGTRLIGHVFGSGFVEIDVSTGVAALFSGSAGAEGQGIASDAAGNVRIALVALGGNPPRLFSVDPVTGATVDLGEFTGLTGPRVNAMAYLEGTLFAVDNHASSSSTTSLVVVDAATGASTQVGPLPDDIDALEGSLK